MPKNRSAALRHEILDECLRNTRKRWSKDDLHKCVVQKLSEKFGIEKGWVSEASIRKDLKDMMEDGAPIEEYKYDGKIRYRYDDPEFSIKNLPVSADDVAKLNLAVTIMQQIKGFTLADEVAEVVEKLERKAKVASSQQPVIAFENKPTAQGTENLGDIYEAIINRKVLKIAYQHFKATEPAVQVIHPYYLKEYNNRWFLFGWSEQNERIEIMALDRMVSIKVTAAEYRQTTFNPTAYFMHLIGVTDPGTPAEKIVLCFSKDRAPYIATRKIHASQQEHLNEDGSMDVELHLKINREFIAIVLGYADDVEVKEPESLQKFIIEKHQHAVEAYEPVK